MPKFSEPGVLSQRKLLGKGLTKKQQCPAADFLAVSNSGRAGRLLDQRPSIHSDDPDGSSDERKGSVWLEPDDSSPNPRAAGAIAELGSLAQGRLLTFDVRKLGRPLFPFSDLDENFPNVLYFSFDKYASFADERFHFSLVCSPWAGSRSEAETQSRFQKPSCGRGSLGTGNAIEAIVPVFH